MLKVINIIDTLDHVNFGIWNAAIATAPYLKDLHQIESYLWHPACANSPKMAHITQVLLDEQGDNYLRSLLDEHHHTPSNTIIVSHGCWQSPTRLAAKLKKWGYKWVYVPHGMLEPWSMQKKWFKKFLYFNLIEQRLSLKADVVRAVGVPEFQNLNKKYNSIWLNQNGVDDFYGSMDHKWENPAVTNYLFMARLHEKKGVIPLVKAWIESPQAKNLAHHLYIAGPDDGELAQLEEILSLHQNINIGYLGAIYEQAKIELLAKTHIYILPSFSEGFPTSVLEAMNSGAMAVITDGCNFPLAIENEMALKTTTNVEDLKRTLAYLYNAPLITLHDKAIRSAHWVADNYNNRSIAQQQAKLYTDLISKNIDGDK